MGESIAFSDRFLDFIARTYEIMRFASAYMIQMNVCAEWTSIRLIDYTAAFDRCAIRQPSIVQ